MMILSLPVEMICKIAERCTLESQASLSQSCHFLHRICAPVLYRNDVTNHRSSSVFYALVQCKDQLDSRRILMSARAAGACLTICQDARQYHALSLFRLDATLFSPLTLAARRGLDLVVSYLIDEGLCVDGAAEQPSSYRKTPLMEAIRYRQESTAILLVHCGASIGSTSARREAFQAAIREGLDNLAITMIERYGLNVNDEIGYGCTPLILAVCYRRESMITTLLAMGADLMPAMRRFGNDHSFVCIVWILNVASEYVHHSFSVDNITELLILFVSQGVSKIHKNQQMVAIEAFLERLQEAQEKADESKVPSVQHVNHLLNSLLHITLSVETKDVRIATLLMRFGAKIQSGIILQLLDTLKPSVFDTDIFGCLEEHPVLLQWLDHVHFHCTDRSSQPKDLVETHFLKHVSATAVELVEELKKGNFPLTASGVKALRDEYLKDGLKIPESEHVL